MFEYSELYKTPEKDLYKKGEIIEVTLMNKNPKKVSGVKKAKLRVVRASGEFADCMLNGKTILVNYAKKQIR